MQCTRHSKLNVQKSNSIQLNWWSLIKFCNWTIEHSNQMEHWNLCGFDPNQSNSIEQMKPNCTLEFWWILLTTSSLTRKLKALTGHREANNLRWRWPYCPRSLKTQRAQPFSPIFFEILNSSPSFTSNRHSW